MGGGWGGDYQLFSFGCFVYYIINPLREIQVVTLPSASLSTHRGWTNTVRKYAVKADWDSGRKSLATPGNWTRISMSIASGFSVWHLTISYLRGRVGVISKVVVCQLQSDILLLEPTACLSKAHLITIVKIYSNILWVIIFLDIVPYTSFNAYTLLKSNIIMMTKCVSPWYNSTVWLGVKHQIYLLAYSN